LLLFRFFKANDLYELFTLTETDDRTTETAAIFAGTGSDVKVPKLSQVRRRKEEEAERGAALPVLARSQEPTRPVVKRSLERLYAEEAAEVGTKSGSGTLSAAFSSSSSLLSEKLRDELREKARKINSLIFKAKEQHQQQDLSSGSSSPVVHTVSDQTPGGSSRGNSAHLGSTSPPLLIGNREEEPRDKKKKKKHKKDKKFEGTRVPHLTKVRHYRPPLVDGQTAPPDEDNEKKQNQDDYVLAKLFAKTGGIHSALRHDAIVDDDGTDHALLEAEAAAAAKAAVKALRESRRDYPRPGDRQNSSSPAAAAAAKRFGKKKTGSGQLMTSADLLARIRARNSVVSAVTREEEAATQDEESLFFPSAAGQSSSRGGAEEGLGARHSELLADIRNFIAFQV
jgi:DNA excision repair protein ERCC-6